MTVVKQDVLSKGLQGELHGLVEARNLPAFCPWPAGTEIVDLEAINRFATGCQIKADGHEWTIENGVDTKGAKIVWDVTIDVDNGLVLAAPRVFTSKPIKGSARNIMEHIGLMTRVITTLGELKPLFPIAMESILGIDLPEVYDRIAATDHVRETLARALRGPA